MTTHSQEDRHRVYIDATIPSYLVSNPSRVAKTAERQKITHEFWQDTRFEFILSNYVVNEISVGDSAQAASRQQAVEGLRTIIVENADRVFAQHLVDQGALPQVAFTDAIHVAVAAIHAIPYLATWNFAHLANPRTLPKIQQVCHNAGFLTPCIDTPEVIMEEISHV